MCVVVTLFEYNESVYNTIGCFLRVKMELKKENYICSQSPIVIVCLCLCVCTLLSAVVLAT